MDAETMAAGTMEPENRTYSRTVRFLTSLADRFSEPNGVASRPGNVDPFMKIPA